MATMDVQLSHLPRSQLSEILQDGICDKGVTFFLYDASGDLLLSCPCENHQGTASHPPQESQADSQPDLIGVADRVRQALQAGMRMTSPDALSDHRCLIEPIQFRDRVLGVLVGWLGASSANSQMASLLRAIVRTMRRRIEDVLCSQEEINALSEEIIDKYRELALIHNLSTELAGVANIERVYQLTLEQIKEISFDRGYIFKRDMSTNQLQVVQCFPELVDDDMPGPIDFGQGIIGEVAETGGSVLIENSGNPIWSAQANPGLIPPLMCCALQIGQETLGVLAVTRDSADEVFTAGDLKVLESAALQSAAAMKNIALLHDLSRSNRDLRHTLSELQQTQAELILSQRIAAIGELVASVAHDLNNPLTSVIGYAEILRRRVKDDERQRRHLALIRQEAQRAASIVRNLLTFSRQRPLEMAPININKVAQAVIDLRTQQTQKRRIEFSAELAPDLSVVMADFHQLQQVLFNLVINSEQAIQQTEKPGKIEIQTQRVRADGPNASEYAKIIVKDNGPGIPPAARERIFEPFSQRKKRERERGLV